MPLVRPFYQLLIYCQPIKYKSIMQIFYRIHTVNKQFFFQNCIAKITRCSCKIRSSEISTKLAWLTLVKRHYDQKKKLTKKIYLLFDHLYFFLYIRKKQVTRDIFHGIYPTRNYCMITIYFTTLLSTPLHSTPLCSALLQHTLLFFAMLSIFTPLLRRRTNVRNVGKYSLFFTVQNLHFYY